MLIFGNKQLKSNVLLAPMAGITDLPFRKIVREFGDFLVFSEMIASQAAIRNVKKTIKIMLKGLENDAYTAVQIVGADPYIMSEATKLSCDLGASFIDINMGCPVKKIVKSDSGSALMKDEKLAAAIIDAVVKASNVPVSLKMRLGWNSEQKNVGTVSRIAEELGISMITVHARTRAQMYNGQANWKEVSDVKKELKKIPLIINGDITNAATAKRALEESYADGVMIGRGALGNPWILKDISDFLLGKDYEHGCDKHEVLKKHIDYVIDFYPEDTSIKLGKKILIYYLRNMHNAARYRRRVTSISTIRELHEMVAFTFR